MSSDGSMVLTLDARANRMENTISRLTDKVNKLEDANARLAKKMRNAGNDGTKAFMRLTRTVAGVTGTFFSISRALSAVNDEIQQQQQLQVRSLAGANRFADEQLNLLMITQGLTKEEKKRIDQMAQTRLPSFTPADAASIATFGFQATLGVTEGRFQKLEDVLGLIEKGFLGKPEEAKLFATNIGFMLENLQQFDAQESFDLLMRGLGQSALADPLEGKRLVRAITGGLAAFDERDDQQVELAQQIAAMFAIVSSKMADIDGALSGTAVQNLASVAREVAGLGPGQLLEEALVKIAGSPQLQAEFREKARGRAISKGVQTEVVEGSLEAFQEVFGELKKATPGGADLGQLARTFSPELVTRAALIEYEALEARRLQKLTAGKQAVRSLLFGGLGAQGEEIGGVFRLAAEESGIPGISGVGRFLSRQKFEAGLQAGGDPEVLGMAILRGLLLMRDSPDERGRVFGAATPEQEQVVIDRLEMMIDLLQRIEDSQQADAAAQEAGVAANGAGAQQEAHTE